jgi:hypothetical protein
VSSRKGPNGWTHSREDIPNGRQARTHEGVWVRKCRAQGCPVEWESDNGPFPLFILSQAEHEASHGIDVPGYNVGLLP